MYIGTIIPSLDSRLICSRPRPKPRPNQPWHSNSM